MSTKKNKSKKGQPTPQTVTAEIDYDKLAHAIASALIEADSIREAQREEEEKRNKEQVRKILREKECPQNAGWLKKLLYSIRNFFVMMWNLLFLRKKDAQYLAGATVFAQSLLETLFSTCELMLYGVDIFAVLLIIHSFKVGKPVYAILFLLLLIVGFVHARYFRLARFEVEYMKDRNYMIGFLSAIASFFAMLFALIGLTGGIAHGV